MNTSLRSIFRFLLCMQSCILFLQTATFGQSGQSVTEIITDYNGYFKSSNALINSVKPATSHNLLAFSYNGIRYSTGVNDAAVVAHGDGNFLGQVFKALPVSSISGSPSSSTKIGLGQLYDGVDNGPSIPPPSNNMITYLTDGLSGLDLGTGVANLPAGVLTFDIDNITVGSINDGIPDIIVTQIADPSSGVDQYCFEDNNGVTFGNPVNINFSGINPVANWTADFYDASHNPMTLPIGFTKTDRPIRLWAADLSVFGITVFNFSSIKKFKIQLNGNSDVAFIGYNKTSYRIVPLKFSLNFAAKATDGDAQLTWRKDKDADIKYFDEERSNDGKDFTFLHRTEANNAVSTQSYYHIDHQLNPGTYFYRLRLYYADGSVSYSDVKSVNIAGKGPDRFSVYPNPAQGKITLSHAPASGSDLIQIYSLTGGLVKTSAPVAHSVNTLIDLSGLSKGSYIVHYRSNNEPASQITVVHQ